jgi:hypothetical protein
MGERDERCVQWNTVHRKFASIAEPNAGRGDVFLANVKAVIGDPRREVL